MITELSPHGPSPPLDPEALPNEKDAHRVELPRVLLARYPVTVAQWRVYFDAVHPRFGKPSSWERVRQRIRQRLPVGEPSDSLDPRSLLAPPTAPVTYVSWYDALDYGCWLTHRLRTLAKRDEARLARGHVIPRTVPQQLADLLLRAPNARGHAGWVVTLPSEAEWEKGARGQTCAWRYPWGDYWDPNRANGLAQYIEPEGGWDECKGRDYVLTEADEALFRRTMVVGAASAPGGFPGGRSPYALEDQSGNIWEWTRSLWGPEPEEPEHRYPYEPDDLGEGRENLTERGNVYRVLRGGALVDLPRRLRSANREGEVPWYRLDDLGFRLVVSPLASGPLISDPSDL